MPNLHYQYTDSFGSVQTGRALETHKGLKKNYQRKEGDQIEVKYLPSEPGFSQWVELL